MRGLDTEALFSVPDTIQTYINNFQLGDLTFAIRSLVRWAGGFYATDISDSGGLSRDVRLFRDGSACLALRVPDEIHSLRIARNANAVLLYLGWLWERHGLSVVSVVRSILPFGLSKASVRHGLLMDFVDRLHQSIGLKRADVPFRRGVLHDRAGEAVAISVGTAELVSDATNIGILATIDGAGGVTRVSTGGLVGWYRDGVLADLNGDTIAVVEFAYGVGCPDNFVGTSLDPGSAGRAREFGLRPPQRAQSATKPPGLSGTWSAESPHELLMS
jgi:hypothetical protein